MPEDDVWQTGTGLTSDYEGTVVDAWFALDPNLNNSPFFMYWKMSTDVETQPEITERWNCGPDWKSYDGGETVIHPTKKQFNNRSQVGILVDKVVGMAGDTLRARGKPSEAATWKGTRWFMEAVSKPYRLADGQEGVSVRNFPAKFLGLEGDAKTVAQERRESAVRVEESPIMGIVRQYAKDLPHAEWVDKVLDLEGVMQDDELVRRLPDSSDDGLYETLRRQ